MKNKKGVGWQYILGMILALLVFGLILYIIFKSKGVSLGWFDVLRDSI
jgi:hypothetical protein